MENHLALCPRGFAIPEVVIADMLSARVGRPAIIPPCGSGDPQGQVWKSIFLLLESISLSLGICNPRGGHCRYAIRADVLFISFLHDQKRNRTKEKSHRLLAKKLKIEAFFLKLAKRPRFARLDDARSLRKTSSIFFTLFC